MSEACCTCAKLLSELPPQYEEKTEKRLDEDRRLECCNRTICGTCIAVCISKSLEFSSDRIKNNVRFATYCPFCQVSIAPTSLPQGLRDPPAYSENADSRLGSSSQAAVAGQPPPYTESSSDPEKAGSEPAEDVLHFVRPVIDSLPSLSLRYGVPQIALRRKNALYSDHLLAGRKTILIPGEHYKGGVSLSPSPVEGEEEELRKSKVRRWMMACKSAE